MNISIEKKSFFLGLLTGVVLTFVVIMVIGYFATHEQDIYDHIDYLESPISYEDKTETSFKVFQVIGKAALALEVSNEEHKLYYGNTVLILGDNFYSDQVVTVISPKRVGTYSYTNNGGMTMAVPVITGINP